MLLGFNWELHAWIIPLTFATGWVIGYYQLRRKHPQLWEEALRREAEAKEAARAAKVGGGAPVEPTGGEENKS